MLFAETGSLPAVSLDTIISRSMTSADCVSLGADIEAANAVIFDPAASPDQRHAALLEWIARHQPCLFGRFGARKLQGIGIDVCWIERNDIKKGDLHLQSIIQHSRRRWKQNAAAGNAHGFLIVFNDQRLSQIPPGQDLLSICEKTADLYLVEHAPVERDVIYTEAVPLMLDELTLFKAGINIFYPRAHRTRHHDRRCPSGLIISVNSPGHWANSQVKHGRAAALEMAVDHAMDTALRSIGNGGMGETPRPTCTWHNRKSSGEPERRQLGKLPRYVPENHSQRIYSALYHTDVLIPTAVTIDGEIDPDIAVGERWEHLILDYISEAEFPPEHVNYALFHGHPIPPEAIFHNPWAPRRAINSPLADY